MSQVFICGCADAVQLSLNFPTFFQHSLYSLGVDDAVQNNLALPTSYKPPLQSGGASEFFLIAVRDVVPPYLNFSLHFQAWLSIYWVLVMLSEQLGFANIL